MCEKLTVRVPCIVTFQVIQRRKDGKENFYRNWSDYRKGFGNKKGEYWLG